MPRSPYDNATRTVLRHNDVNGKPGRHIAVEGCLGVGKTTWAHAFAHTRAASLVLEDFEKNPFLAASYADPVEHALETELNFLLIHYHQLKSIQHRSEAETITDFTFFKDCIFADANLPISSERDMFDTLYRFLDSRLRSPDLVIYLRGSDRLILERIRQRNRSFELEIDTAYFAKINRAYEDHFSHFAGPFLVIDAERLDCVRSPEVVGEVSRMIDTALEQPKPSKSHT